MKYILFLLIIIQIGCETRTRSQEHKNTLEKLITNSSLNSPNELINKGEKALQVFDEVGFIAAEELAQDGLTSLTWESLEESLMFFEMALKKDQGNEKALFYLSLLKPLLPLKGFLWRAGDLDLDNIEFQKQWLTDFYGYKHNESLSFFRFIYSPYGSRLKTFHQFQLEIFEPFSKELASSYDMMQKLLTNEQIDFNINLPSSFTSAINARIRKADLKAIQSLYRQYYIFAKLSNSYNYANYRTYQEDPSAYSQNLNVQSNPHFYTLGINTQNFKDPQFGLLADPNIFKMLKDDTLGLIDSLEEAIDDLKARYTKNENDAKDFIHADRKKLKLCYNYDSNRPYYTYNSEYQSVYIRNIIENDQMSNSRSYIIDRKPEVPCPHTLDFHISSLLLILGTNQRESFELFKDGQYLNSEEELNHFVELDKSESTKSNLNSFKFQQMRDSLIMPTEMDVYCEGEKPDGFIDHVVVDFPNFAEHPVLDLKSLNAKSIDPYFNQIYYLEDPTLGGLYKPTIPCYNFNQKLAKEKGLL